MKGAGLAVAVTGRGSPLAAAHTLWRFSRPHTLIVTTTSIFGIYVIAAETLPGAAVGDGLGDLALTLLAGALVNLYIVGINQCEDVEIDRVNKPGLPIPAGLLSVRAAWRLVTVSGLLALAMALTTHRRPSGSSAFPRSPRPAFRSSARSSSTSACISTSPPRSEAARV